MTQLHSTGPTASETRARRQVKRVLNKHTGQLTEKALAKALTGDATALLACAQLLAYAAAPEPKK